METTCLPSLDELNSLDSLLSYATDQEASLILRHLRALQVEAAKRDREQAQQRAEQSLHEYVKQAWQIVEPDQPFVDNWHIRAICQHLENIIRNKDAPDLLMNIPPGCMKSLLTCVFAPTWAWGPAGMPGLRFLFASYEQGLSTRDSVSCRSIIDSPWYKSLWGKQYKLLGDQNEKTFYKNNRGGWRLATSVGGRGTGLHPDIIGIDDPHNVRQSESDTQRQAAIDWFTGTISSRGMTRSVRKVVIMQRLHVKDLSGHIIKQMAQHGGWDHICLPMEWEPDRMQSTSLGWCDERTATGELLWPSLVTAKILAKLKSAMMSALKIVGQLQQRPVVAEGNIFRETQFRLVPTAPAFEDGDKVALYWDKASVQDGGDWTVGVLLMIKSGGSIYVLDVTRGQWGIDSRNQMIEMRSRLAASRYPRLKVWVEQEPGSGGKESAEYTVKLLRGLSVQADRKGDAKEVAWEPWASQVNAGNVSLVEAAWNEAFLREHTDAPNGDHDDQIDASAGAFNKTCGRSQIDLSQWLKAGAF